MNIVNLMGRLTKDPELRKTQSGKSIASFRLAVRRDADNTDYIACVAWNNTAEFIERYFHKGNMLAITGHISTREYTDNDGKTHQITEVVAEKAYFTGEKAEKDNKNFEPIEDNGELPF